MLLYSHKIKDEWCPNAFLISFKLETNEEVLLEKTYKSLEKTKSDFIIANILQERYERVMIISKSEKMTILKDKMKSVEEGIVKQIIKLHEKYINC